MYRNCFFRIGLKTKFLHPIRYNSTKTTPPNTSVEQKISHYWILLKLYMKSSAFTPDWQAPVDIPVQYALSPFSSRNLIKNGIKTAHAEGTLLPDVLTQQLCQEYLTLDKLGKEKFLEIMSTQFGIDTDDLDQAVHHYVNEKQNPDGFNDKRMSLVKTQLRNSLVPLYENLFDTIIKQKHGMKWILDLRKDLLDIINNSSKPSPNLVELNNNMKEMLSSWFSMGFLQLNRLTWETPAFVLEKIMTLERVHMIIDWNDLKRRVGLARRLFCFLHPSMPEDPLVFIQVALTTSISNNIQDILNVSGTLEQDQNATTAIFYSITSTQEGLNGIELGNFLIKRVVGVLQRENHNIVTFSTLSPIPGFIKWLQTKIHYHQVSPTNEMIFLPEEIQILKELDTTISDPYLILKGLLEKQTIMPELRSIMMRLCSHYLYHEKKRGKAFDPVANFHIRNGAIMWRLNWNGDVSKNGIKLSYGMMMNYKYELDSIEKNNEQYLLDGKISVGDDFIKYLIN